MTLLRSLVSLAVLAATVAVPVAQDAASGGDTARSAGGVIRGVVTAAESGRPIRRADIAVTGGPLAAQSRMVRADDDGRYEVTGLAPGRYVVSAAKVGYLSLAYGQRRPNEQGRPVDVSASRLADRIDLALPRASVIVARVTDEYGDPVRGVAVRPLQPRFFGGYRQLMPASGPFLAVTDDRGDVRLYGLEPGDYYIATDPNFPGGGSTWGQTFFPGTVRIEEAQAVGVGLGEELTVTFPLVRLPPALLSGRIVGSNGRPLVTPTVSLSRSAPGSGSSSRLAVAEDGSFREEHLPAGDYTISVSEPEFGQQRIRLSGDDVDGLVVTTRRLARVRGRVLFEGGAPPSAVALRVAFEGIPVMIGLSAGVLRTEAGTTGTIDVTAADDWRFEAEIGGVGTLRLRPPTAGTMPHWLLKAVRLDGGEDVTDVALDFTDAYDGREVEIVLTQRAAEVTGIISDERGQVVTDGSVVLFSEDESQWTSYSRFIASARPDQQGRFTLGGMPAGRYWIAALRYLPAGEERDPEWLAQLRISASPLQLGEGESRVMNVRLDR